MKYCVLGPEASGSLGEKTEFDRSVVPHAVTKLHFIFQGWLGDHLLSSNPCFLVSENLGASLTQQGLSGFQLTDFEFSLAPGFRIKEGASLPRFRWLKVHGRAEVDDFGISKTSHLVVSERALNVLRSFPLANCSVDDVANPLSFEERKRRIYLETLAKLRGEKGGRT